MPKKSASITQRSSGKNRGRSAAKETEACQRLQRYLASAGYGSRRQCEELIEAGRVDVDGTTVTKLGTTVDPSTQKVRVDGVVLKKQKLVYYAVNKPVGVVTTNRDPKGRARVVDLVPPDERVFPVGRLDRSSEGLILLTNDGDLAQKLTHPKFGVRKVYRVTVAGKVDTETMRQMRKGIYIAEGFVRVEGAKLLKSRSRATELEIVLREGKNREIRRILARLGHKVQHLRRIAVGPLRLGDVPPGAYRIVTSKEVEKLWLATEESAAERSPLRGVKKRGVPKGKQAMSNRRPVKKKTSPKHAPAFLSDTSDEFAMKGSATRGSVIGADSHSQEDRGSRSGKGKPRKTASKRDSSSSSSSAGKKRSAKKRPTKMPAKRRSNTRSQQGSTNAAGKSTSRRGAGRSKVAKRATKKRGGNSKPNQRKRKK